MIAAVWHAYEDRRVLRYLAGQIEAGAAEADAYGHTSRAQKFCKTVEISDATGIKPFKTREILERLKKRRRIVQAGTSDLWCVSNYEVKRSPR